MTLCRLSQVFMPSSVPSASANRWLSESCTSNAGSAALNVDTLGKAFSQGVITGMDEWRNYAGGRRKGNLRTGRSSQLRLTTYELVPQGQAMAQPFAEEHVELGFSSGWCIAAFG
jgi:hypothetical protein